MKKVMVIAGGDWQIELIKKIKSMGYYVICSNLYENSPAFPYADACEVADVLDKEANLKIAKKYMPDAVISDQSDIAVSTVAYLNEHLGLKGIGLEKADLFTDKSLMRKFCKQHGILIPSFKICESIYDAEEMLSNFSRIIIKPIDSQSSRGVFTIKSKEDLEKHFDESISYSNRRKQIIAEEYIGGTEFTIDGIAVNGHHYPLCISVKEMYEENPNVSRMQTYTYSHNSFNYDILRKTNKHLIETIGLPFGLTHSEYKCYDGKFYLIEAGARGGGSNLSAKIVPFISGVDNYDYLIKMALGESVDEARLQNLQLPQNKMVVMRFFDFGYGKVKEVHGYDLLQTSPYMLDFQLNVQSGDVLKKLKFGRMRPGHFIIGGENKDEINKEVERLLKGVYVTFEE